MLIGRPATGLLQNHDTAGDPESLAQRLSKRTCRGAVKKFLTNNGCRAITAVNWVGVPVGSTKLRGEL